MKTLVDALSGAISDSGYTWIPESQLKEYSNKTSANTSDITGYVKVKKILAYYKNNEFHYSLPYIANVENSIAREVLRIMFAPKKQRPPESIVNMYIDEAEKEFGLKLHSEQRAAVRCAVYNPFVIITGGPGTGKTCVLNTINYVLKKLNKYEHVMFSAPTGKAARRITESTNQRAETLHKSLKINAEHMEPTPLDADTAICDEVSMLDIYVANALFKGTKTGTRLILVGDIDQLPSIGPGAVLRDLIDSDVIPYVRLTKTFRQASESCLFRNIQYIKAGYTELEEGDDFQIIEADKSPIEQAINSFLREVATYGLENVVCLTPLRKWGNTCSEKMNVRLQNIINPKGTKPFLKFGNGYLQIGDPVMQLKNRDECANGDVGTITAVRPNGIDVKFIDGIVKYDLKTIRELTLAYAMSIHKSQGSEYKSVIIPILNEHNINKKILSRNLFYTAITRAKNKVVLIREKGACDHAINNIDATKRSTLLIEKLIYMREKYKRVYNI